ncbi:MULTISPECIES: hypothetical protein [unclassified Mesorhizobium]|nr:MULTISPECIES: hypothetical protein [unclassified Mesorhizobium]
MNPKLTAAILLWKRGQVIPVDLAFQLSALGFDVEALERRYSV